MKVELKDLVGWHILSGVETGYGKLFESYGGTFENCNFISFILDGKKYTAVEDPDDGYRSCLGYIEVETGDIENTFPNTEVFITMDGAPANVSGYKDDVASFYSVKTARIVLQIGTSNVGDWYPYFVAYFKPENLPCNKNKEEL